MGPSASARTIRKVLVVDDDDLVRTALARTFGRDRTTFTASGPAEAIDLAERERPDLAIVDLRLGTASGVELIRQLRAHSPQIVIALISGYHSIESTVVAVHAGADYVLSKPVTGKDILSRLDAPPLTEAELGATPTLAQAENEHIARVLADCRGNISEAARRLGICRSSLQRRLRKTVPRS